MTTFFPVFPRSPVITAHLTPPSQRATYEKINHLRQKHTTFITGLGEVQKRCGTTRTTLLQAWRPCKIGEIPLPCRAHTRTHTQGAARRRLFREGGMRKIVGHVLTILEQYDERTRPR